MTRQGVPRGEALTTGSPPRALDDRHAATRERASARPSEGVARARVPSFPAFLSPWCRRRAR